MKRVWPALFLLCVLLVGCARPRGPKVEFWTISLRPLFTTYMEDLIRRWEQDHPGIRVEWVDLPFAAIQQKLLAALQSGSPPSVVNLNTDMALQLSEPGALLDLDQAVASSDRARYFPGLWDAVKYKEGHYAIPWYVTTEVIIYNADLFQKAGLDPGKPPSTWEDLVKDAVRIKEKTGTYGWLPAIKFLQDLQEQGIPVVSPDGKKALFDSPEAAKRLEMYVNLFKEGTLPRETLQLSKAYQQAVDLFQSGKLGMLQTGPQFLNRVRDNAPSVYKVTRVAPLPLGRGRVIAAATMNVVVPRSAPRQKEAVDFALFLTNDENQLAFSKLVPVFPSTVKAASNPFFTSGVGDDPLMARARRIGAEELKLARDLTLGLKNGKARNEAVKEALESALLGKKSPQDALHDAAKTWNDLLK